MKHTKRDAELPIGTRKITPHPTAGAMLVSPVLLLTGVVMDDSITDMILGVHHVSIQVADVAAARAFYIDVLGLKEIARPNFAVAGAWFQLGDQQLHIGEDANHRAPDRQHFAVRVDDLDAAVVAIEACGVEVRRLQTLPGAGRQAAIRDPSGNLIELNQPA